MSKAERTRSFIIEKTAPVFNKKGYAGTSITDLTEATGLTKGSIYGNFANKDEVALAAFDFNLKKLDGIIISEMAQRKSVKEKLLVYVDVYNNFLKFPFPDGGCPILNTATEADDTHPGLRQKAADAIVNWKKRFEKLIESGIEAKEISADVTPEQVALTLIAMIEGTIMITKLTGKLNYRKLILQSVEKMIWDL